MHTRRFFLRALAAPLVPIALLFLVALSAHDALYTHLTLSLLIPYTAFTLVTSILSRKQSPGALRRFAPRGPLVFLFFLDGYLVLEFGLNLSIASTATGLTAIMIFSATYVVIAGYLYVLILQQVFHSYIHQQKEKLRYKYADGLVDGKLRC